MIDFSKYSSIKIGPYVKISPLDDFDIIIGGANNVLISENYKGKICVLSNECDYIIPCTIDGKKALKIGARTSSAKIHRYAKENDIKDFEFLGALPGQLGGLIAMNAGLKEWCISQNLAYVGVLKNGVKQMIKVGSSDFEYRKCLLDGVFLEGVFYIQNGFSKSVVESLKKARANQPKGHSFGSVFKNPAGDFAGRLIEDVGLKGFRHKNMMFSDIHANFMINNGGGSFDSAMYLINLAKEKIHQKHGILLECEVKIYS